MEGSKIIKINFRGGIISPGNLFNILVAAGRAGVGYVSFGLRQQMLLDVTDENFETLKSQLDLLGTIYETDQDQFPNLTSAYPATEVFATNSWLTESVYIDVFDSIDYEPQLKINICDSNQSFTPMLTGNINWIAAADMPQFWHLFIRFPKTNDIIEYPRVIFTNDLSRASRAIESWLLNDGLSSKQYEQALNEKLASQSYISAEVKIPLKLPPFNLPYYEGFNSYNGKYWLGIYRRDELFPVSFLKDLCRICLDTRVGQLCSTPWKSLIVKNIAEEDRHRWNALLARHHINVRHAANELNFQVEDNCREGLALKQYLVRHLNNDDVRTFGVAIGIKTRRKSEVFGSILIRKRNLVSFLGIGLFPVFDILCSRDFNPNERTGSIYSRSNFRWMLPEQLRRAIIGFYRFHDARQLPGVVKTAAVNQVVKEPVRFQCKSCLSVYNETNGAPERGIVAGTSFQKLPPDFCCELCDAPLSEFTLVAIKSEDISLQNHREN